ncbi:MAG TPA: hypothetical protein VNG32_02490 [Candidatus Dormibacteraeota bacterium]|nr:hypothetical protein [Candidatus Dormibacteraeota bacterium]
MGIEDRLSEVHEHDAREAREAEIAAQRDRKRYSERTVFKEHWGKITQAIVESGQRPNAQVATPQGIALGNEVIKRKPRGTHTQTFFAREPVYYRPRRESLEKWKSEVHAAIGPHLQPAWDMQSYAYLSENTDKEGSKFQFIRSGSNWDRLFLAQDATIYRAAALDPFHAGLSGYSFFPISAAMELNDETHFTIEKALAHMVVRRALTVEFS